MPRWVSGTVLGVPGTLHYELGFVSSLPTQSLGAHPLPQVRNPGSRERAAQPELPKEPGRVLSRPFSSIPSRKGSPCCPCSFLECNSRQHDSLTARPGQGVPASVPPGAGAGAGLQFSLRQERPLEARPGRGSSDLGPASQCLQGPGTARCPVFLPSCSCKITWQWGGQEARTRPQAPGCSSKNNSN